MRRRAGTPHVHQGAVRGGRHGHVQTAADGNGAARGHVDAREAPALVVTRDTGRLLRPHVRLPRTGTAPARPSGAGRPHRRGRAAGGDRETRRRGWPGRGRCLGGGPARRPRPARTPGRCTGQHRGTVARRRGGYGQGQLRGRPAGIAQLRAAADMAQPGGPAADGGRVPGHRRNRRGRRPGRRQRLQQARFRAARTPCSACCCDWSPSERAPRTAGGGSTSPNSPVPKTASQAAPTRAVLADLIDARLVTADADTVEITHETLLTAWPRLRQWLTEDRAGLRIHRDLTDAARDWQHEGRDPGRLFRGTRLAVARDWAAHHGQDLNADERAFLAASQHDQLRTTRRRRAAVAALAALTVLSATTAGVAIQQRSDALTARDQAIANQIAVEAGQLTATDPSLAAQLDVAANQISPTPDSKTRLLDTTTTPLASRLTGPTSIVYSVAFSPDGKILAAGSGDQVWLWNLTNPAHPTRLGQLLTGPASDCLLGGVQPGTGRSWPPALSTQGLAVEPDQPGPPHPARPAPDRPRGHCPLGGVQPGRARSWPPAATTARSGCGTSPDPAHPTPLGQPLTGPTSTVDSVAFSPDGQTLAAGSDDQGLAVEPHQPGPPHPARPAPDRPQRTLSTRWRSARTGRPWPPAATTTMSGCGTSPIRPTPPGSATA